MAFPSSNSDDLASAWSAIRNLLYHTLGADGRIVQRTLTPAQTAGLRTQLAALIATID